MMCEVEKAGYEFADDHYTKIHEVRDPFLLSLIDDPPANRKELEERVRAKVRALIAEKHPNIVPRRTSPSQKKRKKTREERHADLRGFTRAYSEVMAERGNTFSLQYPDGSWVRIERDDKDDPHIKFAVSLGCPFPISDKNWDMICKELGGDMGFPADATANDMDQAINLTLESLEGHWHAD